MNFRELYKKVLKNICEKPIDIGRIYEIENPDLLNKCIRNDAAIENDGFFSGKLKDDSNEDDCAEFCLYILQSLGMGLEDFKED